MRTINDLILWYDEARYNAKCWAEWFGVEFTDSDGSTKALLASTMPVPADSSLEVVSGKFVLETGDKIQAKASAASDIEMFVSMLEIT